MRMRLKKSRVIRGGTICALFAALSLPGCGGYFSGQWPNLAEGFEDAAERDAALADRESEPQEETPAPVPTSVPALGPAPIAPETALSPEAVAGLATRLHTATLAIAEQRQAYEAARADFLARVEEDGARRRWLTAQLRLTGLSRSGDGLNPVLQELQPVARECPRDDSAAICELSRRAEDAAAALAAYLAEQRRFLTAQDPAGPS